MKTRSSTPVLFLVFNRPSNTKKVFDAIRQYKPARLFIAADGPRATIPGEFELCREVRQQVLNAVDWPCEVKTLFRENNLGCGKAVSSAISWFFKEVEEGIILEDDCLPDFTFFPFCEEMLRRYREDPRVMSISGSNLLGRAWKADRQSYFWGHGGIWGWATWRRAWALYDGEMRDWSNNSTRAKIKAGLKTRNWYNYYYGMFDATYRKVLDTWDVQWFYSILVHGGLSINPSVNLVKNIGFGGGTHTQSTNTFLAGLPLDAIKFPLKHPRDQVVDITYLRLSYKEITAHNNPSLFHRVTGKLLKIWQEVTGQDEKRAKKADQLDRL